MKVTVYGIKNCDTMKKARAWLDQHDVDYAFHDYKTALQEMAQGKGLPLPDYSVVGEVVPDHDKTFIVEVKVGSLAARGEGSSKKEAQQEAARQALQEYGKP